MPDFDAELLNCVNIGDKCCRYTTVQKVSIFDARLSIAYYSILIAVISYIVIYTIYIQRGYQTFDDVIGYASTKVKGTGSVCSNNQPSDWLNPNCTVYDAIDLVYNHDELNALFLKTSITTTPYQIQTICNGNSDIPDCSNDTDCIANEFDPKSQGIYTGVCGTNNKCEVFSWCPLEDDSTTNYVNNIENFTIFLQINVRYPNLKIDATNLINHDGETKLTYGLNLFSVSQILDEAGSLTIDDVATTGAIIEFNIGWDCDFDYDPKECDPLYEWTRLDANDETNTITDGFNFRTAVYDYSGEYYQRTLEKIHGIRILFVISGSGGQFDWGTLGITFGAGLAYFAVATIITDIVLSSFLKESIVYSEKKTAVVHKNDVREELENQKIKQYQNDSLKWKSVSYNYDYQYDYHLMDD